MNASLPGAPVPEKQLLWPGIALKILAAVLTLLTAALVRIPGEIRGYAYTLFQELSKAHALFTTRHLCTLAGEHFIIRHPSENSAHACLVLETAEEAYNQLAKKYDFHARGKIPVIIYPSRAELNACFGWPASESAMGAYWAGVIRVLAPEAWIPEEDSREEVFVRSGPMIHEFTHLVVDNLTKGNVPRWFTEGIAQYEEYRLTGFQFDVSENLGKRPYSFQEMDRGFDRLPDQVLAYRQSFAAVKYLYATCGEERGKEILKQLATGKSISEALRTVTGQDLKGFQNAWQKWVGRHEQEFSAT